MIKLEELNPKNFPLTEEQETNLKILHQRINVIRKEWGKPMRVSSGVRSIDDHRRIYLDLAKKRGIKDIRIPMGSKHLKGAAVDISDPDGSLHAWCKENEQILIDNNLWCEEKDNEKRVHFQIFPPASGNRFFKP